MTVQTETSRSGPYAGAGTTGPFTVGFRFLADTHLQVIRTSADGVNTTLALTTDYSVSGAGGSSGTVTLVTALAVGQRLTIIRDVPFTQLADYVDNDSFPAESHERALDLLTMQTQQNREELDRSLTLPASATGTSTTLPFPQANKLLGWDTTGTQIVNTDASSLLTIAGSSGWTYQPFDGTGAQVAYPLSDNPGLIANLEVFISGVRQRPITDYTLAGTTLTFTSAPPAGSSNILVRWGTTLGIGVVPDGSVTTAKLSSLDFGSVV